MVAFVWQRLEADLVYQVVQVARLGPGATMAAVGAHLGNHPWTTRTVWEPVESLSDAVVGGEPHRAKVFQALERGVGGQPQIMSTGDVTFVTSGGFSGTLPWSGTGVPAAPPQLLRDLSVTQVVTPQPANIPSGGSALPLSRPAHPGPSWIGPETVETDLRGLRQALDAILRWRAEDEPDETARRDAEAWAMARLRQGVVEAVFDPETWQPILWLGGAQACFAYAIMLLLKRSELRSRLHRCPHCGRPLFPSPDHVGRPLESCLEHRAADAKAGRRRRSQLSRIGRALREAAQAAGGSAAKAAELAEALKRRCHTRYDTVPRLRAAARHREYWLRGTLTKATGSVRRGEAVRRCLECPLSQRPA